MQKKTASKTPNDLGRTACETQGCQCRRIWHERQGDPGKEDKMAPSQPKHSIARHLTHVGSTIDRQESAVEHNKYLTDYHDHASNALS